MTPARGPSVAPTKPYTLPAWLKRWVSRTKVQAMSRTPMVASVNARGTARPRVLAVPCGLMLAAIEGAIRASEMPTASHRCSSRRRCGLSVFPTSVAMVPPLLGSGGYGDSRAGSDRFHTHLTDVHGQQVAVGQGVTRCINRLDAHLRQLGDELRRGQREAARVRGQWLRHVLPCFHLTLQDLAEHLPAMVRPISHATASRST